MCRSWEEDGCCGRASPRSVSARIAYLSKSDEIATGSKLDEIEGQK